MFPSPRSRSTHRLLARSLLKRLALRLLWQGRVLPAFWTVASLVSMAVNLILLGILVSLGQNLFTLKGVLAHQLLSPLQTQFQAMDAAVIERTIAVDDTIPVQFSLPVRTTTWVTLTEPTPIHAAQVNISTGVITINAPADIVLPAGTQLPIALDITVPVDTTVPVHLAVDVSIPLNETGLHAPFTGLQSVIAPYNSLLSQLPDRWEETPLCTSRWRVVCDWLLTPPTRIERLTKDIFQNR